MCLVAQPCMPGQLPRLQLLQGLQPQGMSAHQHTVKRFITLFACRFAVLAVISCSRCKACSRCSRGLIFM